MKKDILVTGASGFIGRHTLGALTSTGLTVHAVSRRAPAQKIEGVIWHQVDLLDRAAARQLMTTVKPTRLLHLAWYVEHGAFWNSPENLRWVAATLHLALDFLESGGERFIGAGTYAEYEWLQGGVCMPGVTPERPVSLYGESKLRLHQLLTRLFHKTAVQLAWGRIFNPYGENEDPRRFVPYVVRSLLNGERARCTLGDQRRDYLHVVDLGQAFARLAHSDAAGIVNLCSGAGVALSDVANMIGSETGRPELIGLGDIPTPADTPPFIVGDATRLANELQWKPSIALREGIARTVSYWRARR